MSVQMANKLWELLERSKKRRSTLSEIERLGASISSIHVSDLRDRLDKHDNEILTALVEEFHP